MHSCLILFSHLCKRFPYGLGFCAARLIKQMRSRVPLAVPVLTIWSWGQVITTDLYRPRVKTLQPLLLLMRFWLHFKVFFFVRFCPIEFKHMRFIRGINQLLSRQIVWSWSFSALWLKRNTRMLQSHWAVKLIGRCGSFSWLIKFILSSPSIGS